MQIRWMVFRQPELVGGVPVQAPQRTCRLKNPESSQKATAWVQAFGAIVGWMCDWNDADRGRLGVRAGVNRWVSILMT